ncbi:unnamed protein product, partial [Mesorhabditis spiculigera]
MWRNWLGKSSEASSGLYKKVKGWVRRKDTDDPEAEPVAEEAAQEEPQATAPAAAPATPPPPAAPSPASSKSTATNSSRANLQQQQQSLAVRSPASSTKNQPSAEDISVGSVKNSEVSRAARKLVRLKPIKVSEKKLAKWGKIVEERLKRRKAAAEDPATKPLYTIDTPFPAADRSKVEEALAKKTIPKPTPTPSSSRKSEKPTDDSLPLNAAVMLDVLRGEVKLKTMPDDQVKLDPMAEVKDLRRKQPFFEYEVVYGNTVRSMINASESVNTRSTDRSEYSQLASSGSPRIVRERTPLKITEPSHLTSYTPQLKLLKREKYRRTSAHAETSHRRSSKK